MSISTNRQNRAVALKMLSRDSTRHELDVLLRIKRDTVHPEGIAELLDDFVLVSREMVSYRCPVLEAMCQNGSFCKGFPPEDRLVLTRHISWQLFQSLNSLKRLGIIHNGRARHISWQLTLDLYPLNFLIGFKPIIATVDQLIKKSVPVEDPEKHYRNFRIVDSREQFYGSQPVCLADGAPFNSIWKTSVLKFATLAMVYPSLILADEQRDSSRTMWRLRKPEGMAMKRLSRLKWFLDWVGISKLTFGVLVPR
jgi:hypothetical protein